MVGTEADRISITFNFRLNAAYRPGCSACFTCPNARNAGHAFRIVSASTGSNVRIDATSKCSTPA